MAAPVVAFWDGQVEATTRSAPSEANGGMREGRSCRATGGHAFPARSAALNSIWVFSRIPQTRMIESAGESPKDSKCQIWPTSYRGWPPCPRMAADRTSATLLARRWRLTFVPHRKPESQTCAATALAVHTGPWRQVARSCRQGWTRTSAAPPGTTAENSLAWSKVARSKASIADADLTPADS